MLLFAGLLMWVLIASLYALGRDNLGGANWGTTPMDLQKAQLDTTYVVLVNNTWTPFFFDNVGSWASPQFQITVTNSTAFTNIAWVDTFCAGDAFTAYFFSNQAPNISLNGRTPSGVASCTNFTLNPNVAVSAPAFTWGSLSTVTTGTYNITLVPRISPYSAGRGYIRVTYPT